MAFRHRYRNLSASTYFENAGVLSQGVIGAFKGAVAAVERRAAASEEAAKQARSVVQWITGVGGLGLAIGIGTLIFAAYELFQNNAEMASMIHERLDRIERKVGLLPPVLAEALTEDAAPEKEKLDSRPPDLSDGDAPVDSVEGQADATAG